MFDKTGTGKIVAAQLVQVLGQLGESITVAEAQQIIADATGGKVNMMCVVCVQCVYHMSYVMCVLGGV